MNKLTGKAVRSLGIYVHIPFCKTKCGYCDFYSKTCVKADISEYLKALCKHIGEAKSKTSGYRVDTVYIGGGTPTMVGYKGLKKILKAIRKSFKISRDCEITFEANPNTVTVKMLKKLRKAGYNRISMGVQSANPFELKELGRTHTFDVAVNAVGMCRKAKMNNLSLDLMYGIPGQTPESWKRSLEQVVKLEPEHISCYALKVEEGTPMFKNSENYEFPDDDTVADMYLYAVEYLGENGYKQYEISNFAKQGYESRHNLRYWTLKDYWGFGPSAHSMMGRLRYSYVRDTGKYVEGVLNNDVIIDKTEECSAVSERAGEYVMLSLRTTEGISPKVMEKTYLTYFGEIEKCLLKYQKHGYAEFNGETWRLTPAGFLISNTIISDVLIALENSERVVNKNLYRRKD